MRTLILALALFSTQCLGAVERMTVSICNLGGLPNSVVTRAEAETESVFQSAEVRIEWKACDDIPDGRVTWFVLRLRNDKPPKTRGPASLDAMGKAFIGDGTAYLADAYFGSIRILAEGHDGDAGALLGCVIAHELGHLLLGPGHVPDGVMRGVWKGDEMEALGKRRLHFNQEQRERILMELRTRAELREAASGAKR